MTGKIWTGIAAAVAVMSMSSAALAQSPPTARQMDLARRYVAAVKMEQTFEATMAAMRPALMAQPPESKLTEAQRERLMVVVDDLSRQMMRKLIERTAPLMAEVYTEQELQGLVTFYESPTGQAVVDKAPALAAKMAPLMKELMPEMQAGMRARRCEIIDCKADEAKAGAKTP